MNLFWIHVTWQDVENIQKLLCLYVGEQIAYEAPFSFNRDNSTYLNKVKIVQVMSLRPPAMFLITIRGQLQLLWKLVALIPAW